MPCRCRMCLAVPLSVFLALALSLFPVFSCYAYAEGSPEEQETADERPEEHRSVGSGDEPREGAEEPEVDREAGARAEEGEIAQSVLPEVPSGAGSGSGGSAVSGVDGSSEDAYSSDGWDSESPVSDELGIQPYANNFSVLDTLLGTAWSGEGTQFTIGSNKIAARNGTIIWAVLAAADILDSVLAESKRTNNYLKASDSSLKSLTSLLQKQWGYGYGGTVVLESNSPAAWLQKIRDRMVSSRSVVGLSSEEHNVTSLVAVVADTMRRQWGYGYGGTAVISSNSPAAWLSNINGNVSGIYTLVGSLNTALPNIWDAWGKDYKNGGGYYSNSPAGWLKDIRGYVSTLLTYSQDDSQMISEGFSDVLSKLDNLKVDVSVSNSDLSYVEGKLDSILDVLRLGLARDVIDTLLGDLNFSRLASLSADVEGAISSAFPFCIPAVLKQVLGLLEHEGSAPVWEFDICGSPLVCDFRDFQTVADVSGWVARIGFALVLLANTRRFVFMGGGAVAE